MGKYVLLYYQRDTGENVPLKGRFRVLIRKRDEEEKVLDTAAPTYIKIMEHIRRDIVSGVLEPDQKMDSIKELAKKYTANPNTVQRALAHLEKEGLLRSHRTAGKYVTENKLLIKSIRYKEARKITDEFISSLERLGIRPDELVKLFSDPEFFNRTP